MKYIAIIALLLVQVLTCFAQNFEGKLVYDVHFDINEEALEEKGIIKEDMIKRMKANGYHFDEVTIYLSKDGDYIEESNATSLPKIFYQSSSSNIFFFKKKSKYVEVANTREYRSSVEDWDFGRDSDIVKPTISAMDSTKIILGDTCKLVIVDWQYMVEYYWYSDKFQLDAELFSDYNYRYFNRVFELTNAYPVEITKKMRGSIPMTITLRSYEEVDLPDEIFKLPEMKKSKKKAHKRAEKITGNKIMKIKS